jgi:dolichyl-phosphate-mannose--protein O-mannosyl transferase
MKLYLYTTGILFAVITVGHVWEVIDRSHVFASDVIIVTLSTGLVVWAWRLARTRT